jgi:hypothetical protein
MGIFGGTIGRSPAAAAMSGGEATAFPVRGDLLQAVARCWIVLAAVVYGADLWRQTAVGLTNGAGRPLGDDFLNYWSGAWLAWRGNAAQIYDWFAYHAFQERVVGGSLDFYHYGYPPVLLILTAPLAALPYLPALGLWLVASFLAFYRALRLAMPGGGALLLALATPALFVNAVGGQNGAWTAALIGGGLCLLDRRPALAGVLFGLMAYKPHLALLLPVALLAAGRWTAVAAAGLTAGGLVLASVALFGIDSWSDYLRNVGVLRATILEDGTGVWHRMVSVFVFARRLGAEAAAAYAVQAASSIIAAGIVGYVWWRGAPAALRNAVLVLAGWLATPYLQDYDLVLGAFVAAWLVSGDIPSERRAQAVLAAGLVLVLPSLASVLANMTGFAFGPLFLVPALVIAAAMALRQSS